MLSGLNGRRECGCSIRRRDTGLSTNAELAVFGSSSQQLAASSKSARWRGHLLEPFRGPRAQPDRGKRGFHNVRGADVSPVFARETVVPYHALPVPFQ